MSRQLSQEYPKSVVCAVLGLARSSFYYEPGVKEGDQPLLEAIEQILMRWPFYGYRRVTQQLKRAGWEVGETRVRRLLKVLDHTASVGRVRATTTDSQHCQERW
jgi:putative transposase